MQRRRLLLGFGLVAVGSGRAADPAPQRGCLKAPFAQQVDADAVTALAQAQPQVLLERIAALGIDVKRVPSPGFTSLANPVLADLPAADATLVQKAGFLDSYDGRALPAGAPCCELPRATVLIRDTASSYTLLHEVVHLLIVPAEGTLRRADLELQFSLAFRRLNTYQRRLYDDPRRLLDPLWRRDITLALQEVTALLFDRLRIGQSQEAIVESLLADCIDERSPYFDPARRAEGRRYGESMIDNAIDVFNAVNAAVEFCDEAVRALRADLAAGRLETAGSERLSTRDQEDFSAGLQGVRLELARVRNEIEALKRFYVR